MQVIRRSAVIVSFAALPMFGCSPSGSGSTADGTPTARLHVMDGSGSRVRVTGRLEGVGGPAPGAPRPWSGTVEWTGPTHGSVLVAADGRFVLSLPPGRYELTGRSPLYGDGAYLCRAPYALVVGPGRPGHLDVLCQMT
jgi:hypothetical protein